MVCFLNSRYVDAPWRGRNHHHQVCSPSYHMIGGSSLASNYSPRLMINTEIQRASNFPSSRPETLAKYYLPVTDLIRSPNSTSDPSTMIPRAPARETLKRKNPDSIGSLDLDLSLRVKTKADLLNCEQEGDDGVAGSNLCLSLNSFSDPRSDKIVRLRGASEYRGEGEEEEEEGSEVKIKRKKTSTLDLTL